MRSISGPLKICLAVYFLIVTAFLCRILFFTDVQGFANSGREAKERDYTEGWTLDTGETVNLSGFRAEDHGGRFAATKVLPDTMQETDAIYLSTSNLRFRVYVKDALIYSFDTRENMTGNGDGISYHMIGLGSKDEGETIRIEGETVFSSGKSGRINDMQYGAEELYRYSLMSQNAVGLSLSILMIIFGIVVMAFYVCLSRKSSIMKSLWGLGLSAMFFGLWSLCDTGIPQLLNGCTYACREMVYGILHLAGFPMIWFVSRVTLFRKKIYLYISLAASVVIPALFLTARYVFGKGWNEMEGVIYFSYLLQLIILAVMLIDNEIHCRKNNVSSGMKFFYIGAGIFLLTCLVDLVRFPVGVRTSMEHGSWFRFGLVIFFILMTVQIFVWWSYEKSSLERDRFINRLLQYVMDTDDPEIRINKALEYLCTELHADRSYIFEDMHDGTFDNTYEFCDEGVSPEIDNLKGVPYEGVIDVWYNEYKKGGHILIYDIEKYRYVSRNMYEVLKPQGINTLVTGPLILGGRYIGFFGVDNPPVEAMEEISEIIRLLMFFLSEMISQRDNHAQLVDYSFHDALTGAGNRRAIKEFEEEELDTSRPYGLVMCDVNGLKAVNDTDGHEAGDRMIRTVALCLEEVFGVKNVYRMGGDEFAVYSCDETKEEFERKIGRIRTLVEEKGIHVAVGCSYAENGDPDYNSHRKEADNRMYDEKRKFYSGAGDRRKRYD
ncbi:MAG: diguanylate cyclase [Lachnospiraceae bacterium]|nr:diguanylate cyclase [Lachnospiraceae bacterium]